MKPYHCEYRRNGTEDEILICRPNGEQMAVIQYWEETDTNDAERAEKTAKHVVDALNAYNKPLRLPRRLMTDTSDNTAILW